MISKEEFYLLKSLLKTKGLLNVKILSGSMSPLIREGDTIEIEPVIHALKFGDIIVFLEQGVFNCHVFLKYLSDSKTQVLTMGLSSSVVDIPVDVENIIGISQKIKKPFWYWLLLYYRILKL